MAGAGVAGVCPSRPHSCTCWHARRSPPACGDIQPSPAFERELGSSGGELPIPAPSWRLACGSGAESSSQPSGKRRGPGSPGGVRGGAFQEGGRADLPAPQQRWAAEPGCIRLSLRPSQLAPQTACSLQLLHRHLPTERSPPWPGNAYPPQWVSQDPTHMHQWRQPSSARVVCRGLSLYESTVPTSAPGLRRNLCCAHHGPTRRGHRADVLQRIALVADRACPSDPRRKVPTPFDGDASPAAWSTSW